ncbi:hypothetical protein NSQ77_19980 [Oceanobacillus sp. FSL K6-2867]|uniref:hypothetical protein n=1 Tax=Oceanobacillus sp. FSL K6-2867 TaxID=2954748 RepID=UPI0030D9F942
MKVVNNDGKVIEVTEKAFEVLYKDRGFKKATKKKTSPTSKKESTKTDSPTEKKVNENDRNE